MRKLMYGLVAGMLFLASCSKKDVVTDNGGAGPLNEPGFGSSIAPFAGLPWQLPAGIALKEKIHYFEYCNDDENAEKRKEWIGVPNSWLSYFAVCITFSNNTGEPIEIKLPPVILIESVDIEYQNGMIITNSATIDVPANGTVRLFSPVFCVNAAREAPLEVADEDGNLIEFELGPSAVPAALKEIADILKTKNLSYALITKADGTIDSQRLQQWSIIQDAIWEVTDGEGLTEEWRQKLRAL